MLLPVVSQLQRVPFHRTAWVGRTEGIARAYAVNGAAVLVKYFAGSAILRCRSEARLSQRRLALTWEAQLHPFPSEVCRPSQTPFCPDPRSRDDCDTSVGAGCDKTRCRCRRKKYVRWDMTEASKIRRVRCRKRSSGVYYTSNRSIPGRGGDKTQDVM